MDWQNERYVRLYVRRTIDDALLSWQARALWKELLTQFDRAGVIQVGPHGIRGIAALVDWPLEEIERALPQLVADGRLEDHGSYLVAPNFEEAQEARQSDRQRQAEARARRRELARAEVVRAVERGPEGNFVTKRDSEVDVDPEGNSVTKRDGVSQNVTECHETVHNRHTVSHGVTLSQLSQPSQPSLALVVDQPGPRGRKQFDLEKLYRDYPKKRGKQVGLDKLKDKIKTDDDYERVESAVLAMAMAWKGRSTEFCPDFSTFVNQRRWLDDELPLPKHGDNRDRSRPSTKEELDADTGYIPFDEEEAK